MAKSLLIFLFASGWLLANPASAQSVDPGIRTVGAPAFLDPVPGANATEQQLLFNGIDGFGQGGELTLGMGPRFNAFNCCLFSKAPRRCTLRSPMRSAYLGYGSLGAARAVEQLRLISVELQMAPTRTGVHIAGADAYALILQGKSFDEIDSSQLAAAADRMLNELSWWATALNTARARVPSAA